MRKHRSAVIGAKCRSETSYLSGEWRSLKLLNRRREIYRSYLTGTTSGTTAFTTLWHWSCRSIWRADRGDIWPLFRVDSARQWTYILVALQFWLLAFKCWIVFIRITLIIIQLLVLIRSLVLRTRSYVLRMYVSFFFMCQHTFFRRPSTDIFETFPHDVASAS